MEGFAFMFSRKISLIGKAFRLILGVSSLVLILIMSAHAYTGKVIDVFGAGITTIQVEGVHSLKAGDKIDLTYMAGVLPMQVGVYEITTVQANIILSKPVSITMPADKGMKVQIDVLNKSTRESSLIKSRTIKNKQKPQKISLLGQEFMYSQPDPQAMESEPGDLQLNNSRFENVKSRQADQRVSTVKIKGEVIEVMGEDVRIKLISSGNPRKGFAVDLIYLTSSGINLPVGTWTVTKIKNREVVAVADDKNVKPRVGMKALVYMKQSKVGRQKQSYLEVDEDGFPKQKIMFEQRALLSTNEENSPLKTDENFNFKQKVYRDDAKRGITRKYLLGVEMANCSKVPRQRYSNFSYGVILITVMPNSAAQRGGLKKGDMIYTIDGTRVKGSDHFIKLINSSNGKVKLKLQRSGRKLNKRIKLDKI